MSSLPKTLFTELLGTLCPTCHRHGTLGALHGTSGLQGPLNTLTTVLDCPPRCYCIVLWNWNVNILIKKKLRKDIAISTSQECREVLCNFVYGVMSLLGGGVGGGCEIMWNSCKFSILCTASVSKDVETSQTVTEKFSCWWRHLISSTVSFMF